MDKVWKIWNMWLLGFYIHSENALMIWLFAQILAILIDVILTKCANFQDLTENMKINQLTENQD